MDSNNISRMEMDALKEIGNIGVGKAATSLSKMLDKRISIAIPESRILPLIALADQFGGPENIVQSIYLKINGDLKGKTMLLFPDKVALLLVDLISGLPEHTTQRLDGESMSAFAEFGNIFVGNFLNGLSDLLNLRILPELPLSARDMVQSLMDAVLIELGRDAD
ncbi:chemotaxis protein CheC, partial [Candidatus Woesearchaeota archaeon]|nr:chemotaxis protein CheC [Candidatus Woesearchaeota archaeon]